MEGHVFQTGNSVHIPLDRSEREPHKDHRGQGDLQSIKGEKMTKELEIQNALEFAFLLN
jgi:hypothetical protein